jgi:hypothetical protein
MASQPFLTLIYLSDEVGVRSIMAMKRSLPSARCEATRARIQSSVSLSTACVHGTPGAAPRA